ncbi:hypothetical protein FIV34_11865 [Luteibacter pinisoli]|uniref:Peptidase M61 catalytic domain-containing protein n=1 Tax=Luteibacter pinisoli TaxID=2589080 RepID=A0A4Y5Z4J6_9GAMM|nr:hypothetical protein [Luteibacter pinisoli]QDE39856.1 hypothetical protein FIV34_11865 [Luteibacter pinisoli]
MKILLAALLLWPLCAVAGAPDGNTLRAHVSFSVTDGAVTSVHVEESWTVSPGTPPTWSIPTRLPGLPHLADSLHAMAATDDAGDVPLNHTDVDNAPAPLRRWTPVRAVDGTLTVRYTVTPQPASEAGGPPIGLIGAGGGIAGETAGMLALPESTATFDVQLTADVSALAKGSVATSSKGEFPVTGKMTIDDLQSIWVLFGPARRLDAPPYAGFALGAPPADAGDLLAFGQRAYTALASSFGYLGMPRYRLFLRAVEGESPATGTSESGGALVTLGSTFRADQKGDYIHDVLFHEMAHNWVGHLSPNERWFSEGLATYVANVIRCEHGLDAWAACAAQLTEKTGWALDSRARNWPMDKMKGAAFSDAAVQRTPYGRGMLYFAALDATIRERSAGKKTLLSALAPVFAGREQGKPITRAVWEAWLTDAAGPSAVGTFHRVVINGEDAGVPRTAFPDCLAPVRVRVRPPGATAFADSYTWVVPAGCRPTVAH